MQEYSWFVNQFEGICHIFKDQIIKTNNNYEDNKERFS